MQNEKTFGLKLNQDNESQLIESLLYKVAWGRLSHNPTGKLTTPIHCFDQSNVYFASLHTDDEVKEQKYIATFLSCWPFEFALPIKEVGHIHPEVFEVASMMALQDLSLGKRSISISVEHF